MSDYDWLFDNSDPLQHRDKIRRDIRNDDPSFPETIEYKNNSKSLQKRDISQSSVNDLADSASSKLLEGVKHLENEDTISALTSIVTELNEAEDLDYKDSHKIPGDGEDLEDPEWASKLAQRILNRIGKPMKARKINRI